jgi:hypothetical protein
VQSPITGDYYYISYRQQQGYDASLSTNYSDRTNIHRYAGSGYANTKFIAALQDTQFIDDPQNGFSIRQLAHDATSVTVQITTTCVHVAPTVSMSPARQTGKAGTELSYTFTVKNNDPLNCGMQNFPVSAVVPAEFTFTQSAPSLELSPGVTSLVTLRVTSPATAQDGDNSLSASTAGVSASAVYAVDNSAPTTVTLTGSTAKKGMVSLSWTASTYSGGISSYRVMKNGVQIASVTTRSWSEKQPTVVGTYDYTVIAVGANGATSSPSNAFRFTVASTSGGSGGGGKPPRK